MEFVKLECDEFNNYMLNSKYSNFLQSPKMDILEKDKGWNCEYVGIKENEKIICATKLMSRNSRLGKKYYYAPRGFLIDYSDLNLVKTFTNYLKKYVKKNKGYVLHIDPPVIYKSRNDNGDITDSVDNTKLVEFLKSIGYEHEGFKIGYDLSKQMRFVFVKDLYGKTEQDLLKEMKPNTRNLINKAIKYGLKVRELSYDELDTFKNVTLDTSKRRNFSDKPLAYYQTMYKTFHDGDEIHFLACDLNIEEYKNNLEEEIDLETKKLEKMKPNSGRKKEEEITINGLKKRLAEANEMYKKHGNNITLSVAMFMTFNDEVTYLFSGSLSEYMNFNAQYLIQWEMLKYSIKNNFKRYNFLGIKGNFDPKDEDYGVYKFKKSFGGVVEEYIGDFNLPISNFYYVNKILKRLKGGK